MAEAKEKGEPELPSARLLRISNDGQLFMTFSKEMVFPEDFKERLNYRNVTDIPESTKVAASEGERSL